MDENCTISKTGSGLYTVRAKDGKGRIIAEADDVSFPEAVALIENTMYQTEERDGKTE